VSTADQILTARIAAICRRHCARGEVDDLDAAVPELQALAGDRPDLLAEHAGVSLGWAQVVTSAEARCFQAEAELCRAAGADSSAMEEWVEVGRERAEPSRLTPHACKPRQ
jgi:hypothetical protein